MGVICGKPMLSASRAPHLVLLTILLARLATADNARGPVVIELFTSEGCSSCPPADAFLAELARQSGDLIVLSEHVDYWDHLGWRDPYSSPLFTSRQQAYADLFRSDSVYTPQMIVDGLAGFSGADQEQARKAIRYAMQQPKAVVLVDRKDSGGRVSVRVEQLEAAKVQKAKVVLAVTENNLASSVAQGENAGRTLRHTGVVRSLARVIEIDARRGSYVADLQVHVDRNWKRENARAIILVQDKKTRRIVGAGACGL